MRRVIRCALAAGLGWLALAASSAQAGEPVSLRASPTSSGAQITLGDLFDGAGDVARVAVARAPAAGLQAVLDAGRVQVIAHDAGLDWSNPQGLHRVIVSSQGSRPPQDRAGRALALASGRTSPTRADAGARTAQALVYARNIMAGEILSAADLQWSEQAVAAADSPGDPDLAIGKAARRPLRAGAGVEVRDLASPKVIRRDETVNVAFESDGISLVLEAKALSDASAGDLLQVVNPVSRKVIEAVVTGPGRAVVGPRAESLKAAAFDPTLRTASNP